MIVYNVGREWFTQKKEAETARRSTRSRLRPQGAPLNELRVETREELAALLNAICGGAAGQETTFKGATNSTPVILPAYVNDPSYTSGETPAYIPAFLLRQH